MAKKPTPAPAPAARPRLTGNTPPAVQRRRRDPGTLRDESRGIPDNDFTITGSKIPGQVALNKPSWQKGSLIFRPVPSFNPDVYNETGKLEHDVYRLSPEPRDLSDFTRKYPGVDYLGDGDEAVSFLLYDYSSDEAEYDPATNPYILLYEAVRRAVYRDKTRRSSRTARTTSSRASSTAAERRISSARTRCRWAWVPRTPPRSFG